MIVAGLATFVTTARVLDDRAATVEVLVVDEAVVAGTEIDRSVVRVVEVPAGTGVLDGLLSAEVVLAGQVARRDLVPGEPLLASDLLDGSTPDLDRTFSIPVPRHVIGGLGLAVGDRVDLIGVDDAGRPYYVVTGAPLARVSNGAEGSAFSAEGIQNWVTVAVDDAEALELAAARLRADVQVVRSTGAAAVTPSSALGVAGPGSVDEEGS